jgi:hypothetical protein
MAQRVAQDLFLPFWIENEDLSLDEFGSKFRQHFGVQTTNASIRVRMYSVRKRALAAGFEPPRVPTSERRRGRPSAQQIDDETFSKHLKRKK